MEHFAQLKRRTTDLLQSIPQNLPQMPDITSPIKTSFGNVPHNAMKATWQRVDVPSLPRSSQSVDVVANTAYVFGGEGPQVRIPVDNHMHAIILPTGSASADYYVIKAVAAKPSVSAAPVAPIAETPVQSDPVAISEPTTLVEGAESKGKGKEAEAVDEIPLPGPTLGNVPEPRVGHGTGVIGHRIFLFGGRGGKAMTPLDERGRVWVFDTKSHTWSFLDPATNVYPTARSYHSTVADEQPAAPDNFFGRPKRAASWKEWAEGDSAEVGTPQRPIVGNIAARARDADSDGYGTFFVLGGCLADGGRSNDLWAFDVRTRTWSELPTAPGLPRGGTAFCLSRGRLYRFGGFNGSYEEGGQLDYLQLGLTSLQDTSDDGATVTVIARGEWQSLVAPVHSNTTTVEATGAGIDDNADQSAPLVAAPLDTEAWPGNRSVTSLEAVTIGGGREYLILSLGEGKPSGAGHEAAGKFWGDSWAFQVPSDQYSAASVTDAVSGGLRHVLPKGWLRGGLAEGAKWSKLEFAPYDEDEARADGVVDLDSYGPGPRGWIASSTLADLEDNAVLITGGLNNANERLGDAWILRLGAETRE